MKTVEEKAKLYDEALERAKKINKCEADDRKPGTSICEYIFPELKESEDERIRKEILDCFIAMKQQGCFPSKHKEQYDSWLAWLEKQGKKNFVTTDEDEKIREQIVYAINKLNVPESEKNKLIAWFERQDDKPKLSIRERYKRIANSEWFKKTHEGMSVSDDEKVDNVNKVEPKFKVGDWVTNGEYIWKVTGIGQLDYILQSQNGDTVDDTISYVDEYFHLWTIQDAKDGDVLVDKDNNIGIYKEIESIYWNSYIYLGCDGKLIGFSIGGSHKQIDTNPATKEQRDLLFQKMLEAGYEWDAENKDLYYATDNALYHKKLVEWSEEDEEIINKISIAIATHYSCDTAVKVENWLKSLKDQVQPQPKQEWSEEDERMLDYALDMAEWYSSKNEARLVSDWLKSLKDRVQPQKQWKPSEEQMDALNHARWNAPFNIEILDSLYNDLKKLTE